MGYGLYGQFDGNNLYKNVIIILFRQDLKIFEEYQTSL